MKSQLIAIVAAVLLVVCVEAQESSPTPETQSAEPTAYRQAQAVKPANPKADRALIDAVRKGSKETVNIEPVKQAIAAGADLNAKMQGGYTPLHLAATKEVAELLIDNGANVNAKNGNSQTPLDMAVRWGKTETADLLRKHGGKTGAELKGK